MEAIRAALNSLGAENIEHEPETVYTGAQSAEDMMRAAGVSVHTIHEEVVQDEQQAAQATAAETSKKDQ
mgnify:CR=1 FL=1